MKFKFPQLSEFATFPQSVKNAFIFTATAWIWYYIAVYGYLLPNEGPGKDLIVGPVALLLLWTLRNWARVLCMLCNLFILIQFLPVTVGLFNMGNVHRGMMSTLIVLFFAISTYYLFVKDSADFFKAYGKGAEEPAETEKRG